MPNSFVADLYGVINVWHVLCFRTSLSYKWWKLADCFHWLGTALGLEPDAWSGASEITRLLAQAQTALDPKTTPAWSPVGSSASLTGTWSYLCSIPVLSRASGSAQGSLKVHDRVPLPKLQDQAEGSPVVVQLGYKEFCDPLQTLLIWWMSGMAGRVVFGMGHKIPLILSELLF